MKKRSTPKTSKAKPQAAKTAFGLEPDVIERALLTGDARGLLEDYFGPENYTQLRDLARDAATRSVRGGQRVFILPGIMGSTLGRKLLLIEDILWINPLEIAAGRLTQLKLGLGQSQYHAVGVILFAYLKLKLRLKIAGFNVDFLPFDWRQSLADVGNELVEAVKDDPSGDVMLVAHSLGGLVARAALPSLKGRISRLIMLGTPNHGSFAPVQVLRGVYDVVLKIALVDLIHKPDALVNDVFSTFPGLYEMLPSPDKFSDVDLYDAGKWPTSGPQPRKNLLENVKPVISKLAKADERFFLIAGVNKETVTGLQVKDGAFEFQVSNDGDGTVPLDFALLEGIPTSQTYFVEESHGSLPNNGSVEAAVVDLLSSGKTAALPTERPARSRALRMMNEQQFRAVTKQASGLVQLGSADYRSILDAVAAAPKPGDNAIAAAATAGAAMANIPVTGGMVDQVQKFNHLTIGRQWHRRIELTLAHGSIADVDCPAHVLGIFRNVEPSGAAKAIDDRLDGAITDFTLRRMFNGDVGSVFTVPVGRHQLPSDMVLFVGLGAFDRFTAEVQQLVAENAIRVLVRSRIDEFATVLIGAGSGQSAAAVMNNLLIGFFRGLKDSDPNMRFRGITLCESDPTRFAQMREELVRLGRTSMFDEVDLILHEIEVPASELPATRALSRGPDPVYMIIRQEEEIGSKLMLRVSVLGSGMKAAVVTAPVEVVKSDLDQLLQKFDKDFGSGSTFSDVRSYGQKFASLLLPAEVCTVLESLQDRHLVTVHDTPMARIPWETLTIKEWSPSIGAGLSRKYLADHLPITTWMEQRRTQPTLKLLLIVNPLGDLDGAEREGDRILAQASASIEVKELRRGNATRAAILQEMKTGTYDCVHYAGHAFFDPRSPARSGLRCAGNSVLTGTDLVGISNLPFLIFFNACEAARVRNKPVKQTKAASRQVEESAGIAEMLMRGGIANYLSTYWPVGDAAADAFATEFYKLLMAGNSIGDATLAGRKAVEEVVKARDWADYVLYGNYDFVLKPQKQ